MTMKNFHSLIIMILIGCFELPTTESNNQLKTVFLSVVHPKIHLISIYLFLTKI